MREKNKENLEDFVNTPSLLDVQEELIGHLKGVIENTRASSKRDYFAGQALQGFFSGIPFDSEIPMTEADDKYLQEVARVCFKMADAMLAESQK